VPALALITPAGSDELTLSQRARLSANLALNQSFPEWAPPAWRALVKAMTTGVREPALVIPGAQFRMAGMSHVLAISGFNVAVLVGAAAAFTSLLGAGVAIRALAALLISVLFLVVTEPEVSVLRAGLGAGLAAIVGIRGGRARGLGALGAVAALSLLLDPASLFNAGFQLSYGVVLGLLTLAGPPAERWHRRAVWLLERALPTPWASGEWVRISAGMLIGACISSVVAFTVSTPIALWHGGFASTYAAPISVITMPAAALVTIGGVIAIVVHPVWPSLALIPGSMSCACAGFLDWVAHSAADWPGTCWWIGRPSLWWLVAAMLCVVSAWRLASAWARRTAWACLVLLATAAWMGAARPHAGLPAPGTLRVDALDVGNGSCLLIRAGSSSLLYDAGTSSDDSAGSRRIVPALAALGVRRIDALVLSHAHMEHFSAVPEVVRAFDVRRIVVPQPLKDHATQGREGALRTLNQWLVDRGHEFEAHVDGDELRVGALSVCVLGPALGADFPARGDESLVLRIRSVSSQEPRAAILLTGGLRQAGCDALLARAKRNPDILPPTAICELPGHGSWSDSAAALVAACQPHVLLQSVGASRIRRDRWQDRAPVESVRGTTARLGALRAEVNSAGETALFHWGGTSWQNVADYSGERAGTP
jgi:competence protein ComEC